MLLVARLLDLLTDPLVGLLTDRSRRLFAPQWLMLAGSVLLATECLVAIPGRSLVSA